MKDSLREERQEDIFPNIKLENRSQTVAPAGALQEGKVLKAQVSLSRDLGITKIIFPALIFWMIFAFSYGYSIFEIFSNLIMYLAFLVLILYHRTAVVLTPEKIIIRRHLFKSLVLRKKDIVQTSISKNLTHTLRWPARLLILATLAINLAQIVERIIMGLQLMEGAPASAKLNLFLGEFMVVSFLLVIYYIFELVTPYQQTLKVTTRSNSNLQFFTEKPEELTAIFKNEKE